jgi:hypothetical protein
MSEFQHILATLREEEKRTLKSGLEARLQKIEDPNIRNLLQSCLQQLELAYMEVGTRH